jgi:hypothetical protein
MSRELAKIRMHGGRRGNPSPPENPMPMNQRKGTTCDSTYVLGNWLPRNKHLPMRGKYSGIEYNLPDLAVITGPAEVIDMIHISQ